jgi:hypothetical protein
MGGVVIALERLPEKSTGFIDYKQTDEKVKEITNNLFNKPKLPVRNAGNPYGLNEPKPDEGVLMNTYGNGRTYQIKNVIDRRIWWDKRSSILDPFLETIRKHFAPDFGIDFAQEGMRKNEGLAFIHRKLAEKDIYFVSNIQDKQSTIPVTFRVKNKVLRKWNPYNGEITPLLNYSETKEGINVPLNLAPYESMFIEFLPGKPDAYVTKTDFYQILEANQNEIKAYALQNGTYSASVKSQNGEKTVTSTVSGIPAPYLITGNWSIELKGNEFPLFTKQSDFLYSWTDDPLTRNFSGTGRYEKIFTLSSDYIKNELKLFLDLGKVGNIAEVIINDKNIGTTWMRGQTLEVTESLKAGDNKLVIMVTNTLINRVSAMKEPPPVPEDLVTRFGKGTIISDIPREFGFKPLPASGLMGPVRIVPVKVVTVDF